MRPELQINTTLREVVDHFKKKIKKRLDSLEVLCDACTGVKQKAIKSCLDCGVTFCTSHLEPHINVPKYKKHKLINAVKNLEKYICQKHERPLELFCRDDQTCVCQFCTEGEHKNHNVIPLEEESGQRKVGDTNTSDTNILIKKPNKFKFRKETSCVFDFCAESAGENTDEAAADDPAASEEDPGD